MRSLRDEISNGGLRKRYEAVVIGAGPGGCAATAALCARGARVLLVEANPAAARRFAGEWIHPPGVESLRRLGLLEDLVGPIASRGFAVLANDGLGPIELDYPGGEGLCWEHERWVHHLRVRVSRLPGARYLEGVRARHDDKGAVELIGRDGHTVSVRAERIIVASGRSHRGRRASTSQASISKMAGLVVRGTLPFEGYGHVILGGPGPALAYRIDADHIRLCLDVPRDAQPGGRAAEWLWRGFSEALPASLRNGFRESVANDDIAWAATSFRPRTYDEDDLCLVGDASGVFHPLTAMGITMSVLDAESAARRDAMQHHAARRSRETYVPELLSNAIYQAFVRNDPGSIAIRKSILRSWRSSASQRDRTVNLLSAADTRRSSFVRAFGAVAVGAGLEAATHDRDALRDFVGWLRWPAASLSTRIAETRARSVSWATPESWRTRSEAGAFVATREGRHAI